MLWKLDFPLFLLEGDRSDDNGSGPPDVTLVEPSSGKQAARAVQSGLSSNGPLSCSCARACT
jgi:hypothetical protein